MGHVFTKIYIKMTLALNIIYIREMYFGLLARLKISLKWKLVVVTN